jgi:plastocyanin
MKLSSYPAGAEGAARLGRRRFLETLAASIGAVAVSNLTVACGGDRPSAPPAAAKGRVRGTVVDQQGTPQAIGRIYLLLATGQNQNLYADVDAHGGFDFGAVDVGSYQLRYWAGAQATVPEPNPNPVRITVNANVDTVVSFTIALGNPDADVKEIYAGDDFFQEQPFGELNAPVTVKAGTVVCWYNVGTHQHTVDGGPWGTSGVLGEAAEFMWTASQAGTFGYRCAFHSPQMQAILQVVS